MENVLSSANDNFNNNLNDLAIIENKFIKKILTLKISFNLKKLT
jgi:hypothetical protein